MGVSFLLTSLLAPAMVTYTYSKLPIRMLPILRCRGVTVGEAADSGVFLSIRLRGFLALDTPITAVEVSKFLSVIVVLISAYIFLGLREDNF